MSSMKFAAASALAFAAGASAHGFVRGITANGGYHVGYSPEFSYRPENERPSVAGWTADNRDRGFPDSVYDAPDMICHKSATVGGSSITVAAGDAIELHWDEWPESHKGPVIDYLANANGEFAAVDKEALQFVKIAASGLEDGEWAADNLRLNNNTWVLTIPSDIAAGNYVLRHEIIALHGAGSQGGAQNYPQCINLEITGSGSNDLPSGTLGTALYTIDEEGIVFDLYNGPSEYPIPGPALMAGGSSGGNTPKPTPSSGSGAPFPGNGTESGVPAPTGGAPAPTGSATLPIVDDDEEEVEVPSSSSPPISFTSTATGRTGQPTKFTCYAEL